MIWAVTCPSEAAATGSAEIVSNTSVTCVEKGSGAEKKVTNSPLRVNPV